jgi:flagellar hook protein FlgE
MSFRGLLTGVSGLKAQSKKMEVIGNNLANVNISGYKRERVNFNDIYYQVVRHASAGDGRTVGGINSQDIGMGVQVASIDKIFSQGSRIDTGRTFDFMIEGNDFFVSQNRATSELMLTRNGSF